MPAKKKTAAQQKGSPKKSTAKKVTPKADTKKAGAKGTVSGNGKSTQQKASEILKRKDHHTPSIFKVSGARRSTPIVFTLEDVKDLLKKRKAEDIPTPIAKIPVKKAVPANAVETPQVASKHNAASLADILGFTVKVTGSTAKSSVNEQPVPKKWKRYYSLLCELRDHVRQSLGMHAEDTLKRSQKEDSGDISTSSDSGTDNFDRDFALSVVSSEQEALREIEAAIQRIYKGTYAHCEITGESISDERLEAVPFTRYSLEGQRQHEQDMRYRIRRGGPTSSFLGDGTETVSFGDDDGDN